MRTTAAWCVSCALPILKAVVLIGINPFRSTICKMMSCAASAETEATSYGSPTTVLAILRLKDADELGKDIRQLMLLCGFTELRIQVCQCFSGSRWQLVRSIRY